jgi:hypothetical protein
LPSALYVGRKDYDGVNEDRESRTKDEAIRQPKQAATPELLVDDASQVNVITAIWRL